MTADRFEPPIPADDRSMRVDADDADFQHVTHVAQQRVESHVRECGYFTHDCYALPDMALKIRASDFAPTATMRYPSTSIVLRPKRVAAITAYCTSSVSVRSAART